MSYGESNLDTPQVRARPLAAAAITKVAGQSCELHSHVEAQLLFSMSGTMTVNTAETSWTIPPQRAMWVPPGLQHRATALNLLELRTIYIVPSAIPQGAPQAPRVINVSPLLRELVDRASTLVAEYVVDGRDGRIVKLLLEELDWSPVKALALPILRDARLLRLQHLLSEDPTSAKTLEEWASTVGAASRTLTRLLLREAGMSFRTWKETLLVSLALPDLMAGIPVTTLAINLGYDSPSAFSTMFRRVIGESPSKYVTHVAER